MKATELMIGDYVIRKNVPKEILIVDTIDSIRDIVYLDLDGLGIAEKLENIEPIPFTPEILEKNFNSEKVDFEGRHINTLYTDHNEFYEITVHEYNGGLWEVEIDEIELSSLPTWRMYVCNVHELQHALRLCNINKEIKI